VRQFGANLTMSYHDRLRRPWQSKHAAGAAGLSKTWLLVGLVVLLAVAHWLPILRRRMPPLVYARQTDTGIEVVKRTWKPRELTVLYTSKNPSSGAHRPEWLRWHSDVPDEVGMLPSPDGEWLLVWSQLFRSGQHNTSHATEWVAVRLSDGELVRLTEMQGERQWVLPRWMDNTHVALEGPRATTCFDLNTDTPTRPDAHIQHDYPDQKAWDEAQSRLLSHSRSHYALDLRRCLSAVERLTSELKLSEDASYSPSEPIEYAYLRPLGIPGLHELRRYFAPALAISSSPDGAMLARADQGVTRRLRIPPTNGYPQEIDAAGARLEVFEVASGRRLWGVELAPKPRRVTTPPNVEEFPGRPPWVSPSFEDVRWSPDGQYLSFTIYDDPAPSAVVVSTSSWDEVLRIHNGLNPFVLTALEAAR